jgi:glycine cleavage system H protein
MAKSNPADRKYTKEHEWVMVEGDIVTVGITDHAQELLTDVVFVELPPLGKKCAQKEPLAVVESVKSVSDVYAPLSGDVVEVNSKLDAEPNLINTDAFGAGWIVKIKMKHAEEVHDLMDKEAYDNYLL